MENCALSVQTLLLTPRAEELFPAAVDEHGALQWPAGPATIPRLKALAAACQEQLPAATVSAPLSPHEAALQRLAAEEDHFGAFCSATAVLEHSLHALCPRAGGKLLRDVLLSPDLEAALPGAAPWLQTLCLPSDGALNLRNLVWHGFLGAEGLWPPFAALAVAAAVAAARALRLPPQGGGLWALDHVSLPRLPADLPAPDVGGDEAAYLTRALPALEHAVRQHFCAVNATPELLAAESEQYYSTLDGHGQRSKHQVLLDREVAASGAANRLWDDLGVGRMHLLLDLFGLAAGPNVRARLSHGQAALHPPVPVAGDVSRAVAALLSADSNLDGYESEWHLHLQTARALAEARDALGAVRAAAEARPWTVDGDELRTPSVSVRDGKPGRLAPLPDAGRLLETLAAAAAAECEQPRASPCNCAWCRERGWELCANRCCPDIAGVACVRGVAEAAAGLARDYVARLEEAEAECVQGTARTGTRRRFVTLLLSGLPVVEALVALALDVCESHVRCPTPPDVDFTGALLGALNGFARCAALDKAIAHAISAFQTRRLRRAPSRRPHKWDPPPARLAISLRPPAPSGSIEDMNFVPTPPEERLPAVPAPYSELKPPLPVDVEDEEPPPVMSVGAVRSPPAAAGAGRS